MHRSLLLACALGALAVIPASAAAAPARVIHVSPSGDDRGTGSASSPLRTPAAALALTRGGETVKLAAGQYPSFQDSRERAGWVTVSGPRRGPPATIGGARLLGASHLRFEHIRVTGRFYVAVHPKLGPARPSHHIVLADSELTNEVPRTLPCVTIRSGAHDVRVERNHIHDCSYGVTGPGDGIRDPSLRVRSHHITVADNLMERFRGDGMQFAHWTDVTISGNRMTDMADPVEHNDGIQVMGNVARLRVTGNVIARAGMLFFTQDALGPSEDFLVEGNLMVDAGGYAVQALGTRKLRFHRNTIWDTRYGAMLLRGGATGPATDTVVVDNILDGFSQSRGAQVSEGHHNLVGRARLPIVDNLINLDPGFVDPAAGDYRLGRLSPVLSASSTGGPLGAELAMASVPAPRAAPTARAANRAPRVRRSATRKRSTRGARRSTSQRQAQRP